MEVSEILSLMSLLKLIIVIISGGLGGAVVRYILEVRRAKYEYVIRLHREWWSAEFSEMRSEVYKIVEDFNSAECCVGRDPPQDACDTACGGVCGMACPR